MVGIGVQRRACSTIFSLGKRNTHSGPPSTLVKEAGLIQGDVLKYPIADESDLSIWDPEEGQVEEQIAKRKLSKCRMYGRAGFPLLRQLPCRPPNVSKDEARACFCDRQAT